ncbi:MULTISPECIES: TIGR01548 family HAD-type hydrolase [unclassified Synechococcus]|uniref:TIGR01548 family HAD-type hydrolase n=1 Tax=unclassified Synechococcus TaxID=2626047 RepID=UPI0016464750|nr:MULTISPECIES: TIGR01548 family HAD-type hydrolase [unclassified Synechococcus]
MSQLLLFDIDGVIRDVAGSYRKALQSTVEHYSGWRPSPSAIDALKGEGCWNNDWDASLELLRRHGAPLPKRQALIEIFSNFYFGGDPDGDPSGWKGFIRDEPLLVSADFFSAIHNLGWTWGFVSGAEPPSARFVLEQRLRLATPPLIAMGDAPDKPDPRGLIQLSNNLLSDESGGTVAYLGDTVADVQTVVNARSACTERRWISLAVAPPHLRPGSPERRAYEQQLRDAGADQILPDTRSATQWLERQTGR